MSFKMFLTQFETMMINQLDRYQSVLFKNSEKTWQQEILKVAFKFYDKHLFEQELAKSLDRALTVHVTEGYSLNKNKKSELD